MGPHLFSSSRICHGWTTRSLVLHIWENPACCMQGQLPLSDQKENKRVLYITDLEHAPLRGAKHAPVWQPVWEKHSRALQESTG